MKLMLSVIAALLLTARAGGAQTTGEARISIAGFELAANGADKPAGVTFLADPSKIGQPASALFSVFGCGYLSLNTAPGASFKDGATAGWRVEVTPLKVANHAVTFRLRWARALDTSKSFEPPREDVELTLKPGESRPLDSVPVARAAAQTFDGKPCATSAASLRISVDFPDMDARLIGVELWLIERLPNGQERTQSQSIRGLFNRAIPFYFDSIVDGEKRLDVFGKLVADSVQGGFEINVEAIRALANPPAEGGYWAARWFRSTLHMQPNEVVEVALPAQDDQRGTFNDRRFSIRIKPKQIR